METIENNESNHQQRLRQTLINQPSVEAFYDYADSYRRLAQYQQALKIVVDGLGEFPLSVRLKLLKAQIYFEMSDLNNSLETYHTVVEYTQDNAHAIKAIAQIYIEQKKYAEAKAMLQKLKQEDKDEDAWVERMLNKINASSQDIGRIHSKTLAKLYEQQGFSQEAKNVYQEIGVNHNQDLSKLEKLEICLKRIQERRKSL
ncbi:MAG TPA: tetratricopeptide repeat protein [Oligoflexia bacterium]|nr:tetratricopeptide repeat protein [Oligoflexia bacterium]HMR25731.1 tetratricopeptide repeat protein [Oligoflexia bacterium]